MSGTGITRRGFFGALAGVGTLIIAGCATRPETLNNAERVNQANARRSYDTFHDHLHIRKTEIERRYTDIDQRAYYNYGGPTNFDAYTGTAFYSEFEDHISDPNIKTYMEDILKGYNTSKLLYSSRHIETQALAEIGFKYLKHPVARVRAQAARDIAGAFAFAYQDIFGNRLQTAISTGFYQPKEVLKVCGRTAPDGLAWAYKTLVTFEPIVNAAVVNITDMCSLTCPQGRVITPVGQLGTSTRRIKKGPTYVIGAYR